LKKKGRRKEKAAYKKMTQHNKGREREVKERRWGTDQRARGQRFQKATCVVYRKAQETVWGEGKAEKSMSDSGWTRE